MSSEERRRLSAADSAWLRVDRENNHMIITAVLVLGRRIAFERVQQRLDQRLRLYPRLRQRVVAPRPGRPASCWQDDPHFDIGRQTQSVTLPWPADAAALESFVGATMQAPLDPTRPLWRIYYVENYARERIGNGGGTAANDAGAAASDDARDTAGGASKDAGRDAAGAHRGGAALIVRVHHCVADGIALLRVLLSLADEPAEISFPTRAAGWARAEPGSSGVSRLLGWGGAGLRSAAHFARFLASRADPPSRFGEPLGRDKCAAWSKPIPLDAIKGICRALDGSVNEVLLCALAGALGRVLEDDPGFDRSLVLRGVVPVNLRRHEELDELGNHFGLVFMPLPVGMSDARARLEQVRKAMHDIKTSPEALAWFAILRGLGRVPSWIEALGVELFSRKASLVVTSLAGPRRALHFCGASIEEIMFWVPSAGNIGLGLSVLTYDARVQLGVATDAGQCSDPRRIVSAFEAEIAKLVTLTTSQPERPPLAAR